MGDSVGDGAGRPYPLSGAVHPRGAGLSNHQTRDGAQSGAALMVDLRIPAEVLLGEIAKA